MSEARGYLLLRYPWGIPEIINHWLRYLWSIQFFRDASHLSMICPTDISFAFGSWSAKCCSYWTRLQKVQHSAADRTSSADRFTLTLGRCQSPATNAVSSAGSLERSARIGSARIGPPRSARNRSGIRRHCCAGWSSMVHAAKEGCEVEIDAASAPIWEVVHLRYLLRYLKISKIS